MTTSTRRGTALIAAFVMVATLAACSGDDSSGAAATPDGQLAGGVDPAEVDVASFPVTIDHILGTTVIEEPPRRVLALGLSDADIAVALGVEPIAVIADSNNPGHAYPWLEPRLDRANTELLPPLDTGQVSIEQVLAMRPDVVLATTATAPPEGYDLLTQAGVPVVVPEKGFLEDPWQDLTRLIGRALGRSAQAERVVADTEGVISAVAERHPGLKGKTAVVALDRGADGFNVLTDPDNYSVRLFADLGMTLPSQLADAAGGATAGGLHVSNEQVGLLDADALFIAAASGVESRVGDDSLFSGLATVQRGTYLAWAPPVGAGVRMVSPLSIPYVLDAIEPTLARVAAMPALSEREG